MQSIWSNLRPCPAIEVVIMSQLVIQHPASSIHHPSGSSLDVYEADQCPVHSRASPTAGFISDADHPAVNSAHPPSDSFSMFRKDVVAGVISNFLPRWSDSFHPLPYQVLLSERPQNKQVITETGLL